MQPEEPKLPRSVETAGGIPADAKPLLKDLAGWTTRDNGAPGWTLESGVLTVKPGTGDILTRDRFGDCQIHVEFMTPPVTDGAGQDRGNSGVYVQGRYEVQVLDSYGSETYPMGLCGALYGQHVPLVNASRKPGEWQTYNIIFKAARFDAQGKRTSPAVFTVIHNNVAIHVNAPMDQGVTGGNMLPENADPGPILLQDHGHLVKYRNMWVREM